MSLDKTLKSKSSLARHRNVLNRAERIERLKELDKWTEGRSPFGLPKVGHRKAAVGGKDKAKKVEEEAAAAAPEGEGEPKKEE
ncbi:MAG: small basic protein [Planctomycetes bacterium]|nr:small basic protein [Planctomycetota bacterium]